VRANPRAVLDTHIVLRGLARLRPTSAAVLAFERALSGEFTAVTSRALLGEVRQALAIARSLTGWTDEEIRKVVDHLGRQMLVVPGHLRDLRQVVPEDVKDNPLFEAALEAGATYVVSDDRAVLNLKRVHFAGYLAIEVVPPRTFLRVLDG
jgi:predicted nucleic acid-binding protein